MSKRKIQSRRRRRLELKQRLLVISLSLLLLLGLVFGVRFFVLRGTLITQSAKDAWVREDNYAYTQASVFLPNDQTAKQDDIFSFRQTLAEKLKTDSFEAPEGGSLYVDAYSGRQDVAVRTGRTAMTVKALGVGGEYFLFHPLKLLSGSYISERDFVSDRVVLDDELAWALFGSLDVVGQSVTIGERDYPVVGVVSREGDFASKAAYCDGPGMFMSFSAMDQISESKINCYELVMPNPVKNYAVNTLTESFSPAGGKIIENTGRFSFFAMCRVLGDFGKRSMNETGILYPYWENAARMVEDHAALAMLLFIVFLLFPAGLLVGNLIYWSKKAVTDATDYVSEEIEKMVEEEKQKNYVPGGI